MSLKERLGKQSEVEAKEFIDDLREAPLKGNANDKGLNYIHIVRENLKDLYPNPHCLIDSSTVCRIEVFPLENYTPETCIGGNTNWVFYKLYEKTFKYKKYLGGSTDLFILGSKYKGKNKESYRDLKDVIVRIAFYEVEEVQEEALPERKSQWWIDFKRDPRFSKMGDILKTTDLLYRKENVTGRDLDGSSEKVIKLTEEYIQFMKEREIEAISSLSASVLNENCTPEDFALEYIKGLK